MHTTEFELSRQASTRDYGHCAVYRYDDLRELEHRIAERGLVSEPFNFYVSLDRPEDRWVSLVGLGPRLSRTRLICAGPR